MQIRCEPQIPLAMAILKQKYFWKKQNRGLKKKKIGGKSRKKNWKRQTIGKNKSLKNIRNLKKKKKNKKKIRK